MEKSPTSAQTWFSTWSAEMWLYSSRSLRPAGLSRSPMESEYHGASLSLAPIFIRPSGTSV